MSQPDPPSDGPPPPPEPIPATPAVLGYQPPAGAGDVWVTVYTCRNRQEADLAVAKLQSHGMHARVDGQEMAVFSGWTGGASPLNAKIHVLKRDAAEARAILEEVDRRRTERLGSIPCPKCGQTNPQRVWARPRLVALGVFVATFLTCASGLQSPWLFLAAAGGILGFAWPFTPRWRCEACGTRWIAPERENELDDDDDDDRDGDEREGKGEDADEAGAQGEADK